MVYASSESPKRHGRRHFDLVFYGDYLDHGVDEQLNVPSMWSLNTIYILTGPYLRQFHMVVFE